MKVGTFKIRIYHVLCVFLIIILSLGGCIGFNDKHISQEEAQEIANGITGETVTYVETKELKKEKQIIYVFSDSRGNHFSIFSRLKQKNFDGASYGPYLCEVSDCYQAGVFNTHKEEIWQILDKYELTDYLDNDFEPDNDIYNYMSSSPGSFYMEIENGTPEENRDILKSIAAALTEIDALLCMNYDMNYGDKLEDKYYYYDRPIDICCLGMRITFRNVPNEEKGTYSSDMTTPNFSLSDEERWTADSLYKAMTEELDELKIAE